MSAVASTSFTPTCGQARGRPRGRSRGRSRGKPHGPYTARGSANNRPVPNFMDLDCFAPSPGNTWPPPEEFGVSRSALPLPPFMNTVTHSPRGHPRGAWGEKQRWRGRKRPNENRCSETAEKKVKQDENEFAFWCDPCSRGFKDRNSWNGHRNTHTTCGIDGCPYVAALKLVKIHKDLQHKTGLAKKIWSLESKESIDKWRQERRKNFPTKEKLAEKEADMAGRLERGELLETKHFGQFRKGRERGRGRGRGQGRGRDRDRGRDRGGYSHTHSHGERDDHKNGSLERGYHGNDTTVSHGNGHGVQEIKKEKIDVTDPLSLFETEHSDEEGKVVLVKKPSGIGGALGALMCNYDDSESESDGDDGEVAPSTSVVVDEAENDEFSVVKDEVDDKSKDEQQPQQQVVTEIIDDIINDVVPASSDVTQPVYGGLDVREPHIRRPRSFYRGRGKRGRGGNRPVPRSTLLEKLLAPDIRHERNVVLQCIRHISKNNFYGLNGAAPPSGKIVELV